MNHAESGSASSVQGELKSQVSYCKEKAKSFFPELYPNAEADSFKASTGWLPSRHGIKNVQLRGEFFFI